MSRWRLISSSLRRGIPIIGALGLVGAAFGAKRNILPVDERGEERLGQSLGAGLVRIGPGCGLGDIGFHRERERGHFFSHQGSGALDQGRLDTERLAVADMGVLEVGKKGRAAQRRDDRFITAVRNRREPGLGLGPFLAMGDDDKREAVAETKVVKRTRLVESLHLVIGQMNEGFEPKEKGAPRGVHLSVRLLGRLGIPGLLGRDGRDEILHRRHKSHSRPLDENRQPGLGIVLCRCEELLTQSNRGGSCQSRHVHHGINSGISSQPSIRDKEEYAKLTDILLQVLDALSFAHKEGVIHRDIKPENIFITEIGDRKDFVKVLDFGIARTVGDGSAEDLTRTGMLMGTPEYMSPEQCRGAKNVDGRSDLYSLGVVMYRALTGRSPFIDQVQNAPVIPPRELNADIPAELERITLKAMARFPADRYQTADKMADDLSKLRTSPGRREPAEPDKIVHNATTIAVGQPDRKPDNRVDLPVAATMPLQGSSPPPKNRKQLWIAGGAAVLIVLGGAMFGLSSWMGKQKLQPPAPIPGKAGVEWIYSKPAKLEFTKTEITLGQFKQCVSAGACDEKNRATKSDNQYCNWGYSDRDNHPMNCVDWVGADAFCKWAGGRLPTGDEWYSEASNGGEKRKWPWGNSPDVSCDYAIWGDGNNTDGCGKDSTWPVCSKTKGNSVSGLCDMSGNVWEWTSTDYDSSNKVLRGGSWYLDVEDYLRASNRAGRDPSFRDNNIGFRCVRSSR
jgi:hypothetical protein